jgi:hypothetical protein
MAGMRQPEIRIHTWEDYRKFPDIHRDGEHIAEFVFDPSGALSSPSHRCFLTAS